jgi:hypothetical protein
MMSGVSIGRSNDEHPESHTTLPTFIPQNEFAELCKKNLFLLFINAIKATPLGTLLRTFWDSPDDED